MSDSEEKMETDEPEITWEHIAEMTAEEYAARRAEILEWLLRQPSKPKPEPKRDQKVTPDVDTV
jgi:hypothetical protein